MSKRSQILRFFVNEKGLVINSGKTEAVRNYSIPRKLKQLRRFLGMASWYRKFIANYAEIANPLTQLTKKEAKFMWTDKHTEAYNII